MAFIVSVAASPLLDISHIHTLVIVAFAGHSFISLNTPLNPNGHLFCVLYSGHLYELIKRTDLKISLSISKF